MPPIPFPGSNTYVDGHWSERLKVMEETSARLTQLSDKQMAHQLLRFCLDACKVTHLLRVTDTYGGTNQSAEADDVILSAFEDIVGCALTGTQRQQATMPFSAGGCGLKSPSKTRPAARISALLAYLGSGCHSVGVPQYAWTIPSAWIAPVLDDLESSLGVNFAPVQRWKGRHDLLSSAEPTKWSQKWWNDAIGKASALRLLDQLSPRDQTRLLEQAGGVGTSWMTVTPNSTLHTLITSEEYSLALKWWLGAPIFPEEETERTARAARKCRTSLGITSCVAPATITRDGTRQCKMPWLTFAPPRAKASPGRQHFLTAPTVNCAQQTCSCRPSSQEPPRPWM